MRNSKQLPISNRNPVCVFNRSTVFILLISVTCLSQAGCRMRANNHNAVGIQAFQTGQIGQAINEFQKALVADRQNSNAYYNLGSVYATLGKQQNNKTWLEQAEQLFRQAISLNDQHTDAHRSLAALLIETGREKFAFDLMNTWKQRYPGQTEPLIELARLYQEYGDKRRAGDLLTDALKLDGNNVRALKALGHIRESEGQVQLAMENYMTVLQLDPSQSDVMTRVAALQNQIANAAGNLAQPAPPRYGATDPYDRR